jgi:hypothetical protein
MHRREERGRAAQFPFDVTSGPRFSIAGEAVILRGLLFVEQAHKILAKKTDDDFRLSRRFSAILSDGTESMCRPTIANVPEILAVSYSRRTSPAYPTSPQIDGNPSHLQPTTAQYPHNKEDAKIRSKGFQVLQCNIPPCGYPRCIQAAAAHLSENLSQLGVLPCSPYSIKLCYVIGWYLSDNENRGLQR